MTNIFQNKLLPYDTTPNLRRGTSNWKVGPITVPLQHKNIIFQSYLQRSTNVLCS